LPPNVNHQSAGSCFSGSWPKSVSFRTAISLLFLFFFSVLVCYFFWLNYFCSLSLKTWIVLDFEYTRAPWHLLVGQKFGELKILSQSNCQKLITVNSTLEIHMWFYRWLVLPLAFLECILDLSFFLRYKIY
jgi:hypothetical protein